MSFNYAEFANWSKVVGPVLEQVAVFHNKHIDSLTYRSRNYKLLYKPTIAQNPSKPGTLHYPTHWDIN